MRRKEKEVSDPAGIETIIKKATVCRLGMVNGDRPYVVPLCFGLQDNVLYFHSALKGVKIDSLRNSPNVCFEFDLIAEPNESEEPCSWSMTYQSVIGFGKAVFVENPDEKRKALAIIMAQYSDKKFEFPANKLKATAVIKIETESVTGMQSGI
jgi:nitroimidazol reductase NimA-like FMN-containing flavoprotein (pyridoxamine 5'-phosphate oxidase superfamily)